MSEEQVTRYVMKWLASFGWEILDYDFPGGGTGRKFHIGKHNDKTTGIVIPDIIAIKNGHVVVMENKARDTKSDYDKIKELGSDVGFLPLLRAAYPDKQIDNVIYGIAFAGNPKYVNEAEPSGVSFIVQVADLGECRLTYGNL